MAMEGLMPQARMSGPARGDMAAPQTAEATMGAGPPDAESNVSPEEQAQYDQFVGNALKIIASPKTREGLMKALEGDGKPQEGLANAAVIVVKRAADSARENGVEISGDVMLHGGMQVVEALAETQANAGIADLSEDKIEGAAYRAADLYREIAQNEGTLNQGAAQQDLQTLIAAEEAGQLGALLPGVGESGQPAAGQVAKQQAGPRGNPLQPGGGA